MAEKKMAELVAAARTRWDIGEVAMLHRVGRLDIGEISILISVASPHRGAAFEAGRYLIDRLKEEVPIWKKEFFEDGSAWVGDLRCRGHSPRPSRARPAPTTSCCREL